MWAFSRTGRHYVKGCPLAIRSLGIRSVELLRCYALRKTIEMQRPHDLTAKTDAQSLVIKLMDYHVVFSPMSGASFERATCINLTRHPYGPDAERSEPRERMAGATTSLA